MLPEDERLYHDFCKNFQRELSPQGPFEQTLAAEIIHAAWRLRRCAAIESNMALSNLEPGEIQLDPMVDPAFAHAQQTVDRARAQAHRIIHRATAELRHLQTERKARKLALHKRDAVGTAAATDRKPETPATKRTQSEPTPITRSQPCPCGSGIKYKRCCGRSAPGLSQVAVQSELKQAA